MKSQGSVPYWILRFPKMGVWSIYVKTPTRNPVNAMYISIGANRTAVHRAVKATVWESLKATVRGSLTVTKRITPKKTQKRRRNHAP